jgi:hypothetical protein
MADIGLGFHGAHWQANEDSARGMAVDARATRGGVIGLQVGFADMQLPAGFTPALGYATPPDLRAELILVPVPNRYFAPFVTAGAGMARYADDRLSLLGGIGAEVHLASWLSLVAQWRVVAPDPREVATAVKQKLQNQAEQMPANLDPEPPTMREVLAEHYNLRTYEVTVGYRLVY